MKNAFDAQGNMAEWIQNDWESDDFIRQEHRRENNRSRSAEKTQEQPTKAWHVILAILLTVVSNPLFWIVAVVLMIMNL